METLFTMAQDAITSFDYMMTLCSEDSPEELAVEVENIRLYQRGQFLAD